MLCALTACAQDPAALVTVEGQALSPVELVPLGEDIAREGTYRWELVDWPEGSYQPAPQGERIGSFLPDVRGRYLIERWFVYGLGEDLSHRFIVDVAGVAPTPWATTDAAYVAVNATAFVQGGESKSPEGRALSYQWRLVERPMGSVATPTASGEQASFVTDVAGTYTVELSVFDGELWSNLPARVQVTAQ